MTFFAHFSVLIPFMPSGMGSNIELKRKGSFGITGGFVPLKVGIKTHFGFLANHHVVASMIKGQKKSTTFHQSVSDSVIMNYRYF